MDKPTELLITSIQRSVNLLSEQIEESRKDNRELAESIKDLTCAAKSINSANEKIAAIEKRVVSLERYKWILIGLSMLLTVAATTVVQTEVRMTLQDIHAQLSGRKEDEQN